MTYQLGSGAGEGASKERNIALPPSVSVSFGWWWERVLCTRHDTCKGPEAGKNLVYQRS